MTDVYTAALLPRKPSSDDDSRFRHGFKTEASTSWDCHIHTDAVRALSWIIFMYFLLSDGESPRLVKNTEVELVMKPRHLTLIGNTLVIQPFLTLFSQIIIFFQLILMYPVRFSSKGTVNSIMKTSFDLTDQMKISGRLVVNAISVGNMK